MLRALRNQTKSIFFKCFLVLLIAGFALWGVGDLTGGSKSKSVISVENKNITVEEVLNEINRARYTLPQRPTLEEAIKNGFHLSILNKLEQEILINQEANNLNLNVPLTEKMKLIKMENAFKDPLGKFSQNKFIQSLNNAGLSEDKYLEMIKTQSNFKQLSMPFMLNDHYNEKIIKKVLDWQNEVRDIEYEKFKFISENEIQKPSDETLKKFYDKNKKKYEIPLTRDVKYIEIHPSYFENQVVINKNQIDEKYEIEKNNYKSEEQRQLLQFTTQNEKEANKFMKLIKQGKNFEEIAKNYFDLLQADINIGFLKKSELPSESADLIFKAKLNDTLGPVKTKFGLSIYKILNIKPQKQISYSEIINEIKKNLTKELSIEILFEKLDVIEDLIAEGNNLEEISNSKLFNKEIAIKKLNKVSQNGIIYSFDKEPYLFDKEPQFIKNIWNTEKKELSDIFSADNDTYYLIEVVKESKKGIPSFDLVKSRAYNQWKNQEKILKSKEKAKTEILEKKNKLSLSKSIKRDAQNFDKINDSYLINQIFEIDNNEIVFLVTNNSLIAVRVKKIRTDSYTFDEKQYNELNKNFSKSFFNDFSNFFIENLALKHNLVKNYKELDKYFIKPEEKN